MRFLRLGVLAALGVLAVAPAPAGAAPAAGTAAGGETAYREFGIVTGPAPAGVAAVVSPADARAALITTGLDRTGLAPGTPSAQLRSFRSGEFPGRTGSGKSTLAWIFTYHHSAPFDSRPPGAPVLTTVPDCDFVLAVDASTDSPLSTFQTCRKGTTPAPTPALPGAVGPCGPYGSWFTGYYHNRSSSHQYEGASSYIINGGATVCTTISDQSNMALAWSMVASADAQGWAQSGFAGWPGAGNHWFAQLSPDGHDTLQTWFSSGRIPVGQQDAYRALYNAACTCVQASVNGAVVLASLWSPYGEWTRPFIPQFFGEIHRFESNMPGTTAQHTKFWAMGGQRWTDDRLEGMPCTLIGRNDNPSRWLYSASSCTAFDLWSIP